MKPNNSLIDLAQKPMILHRLFDDDLRLDYFPLGVSGSSV